MRRNASTVVVLAGPAPGEVLAALGRSMNVALIRPEEGTEGLAAAAEALQRAGRATSPYATQDMDRTPGGDPERGYFSPRAAPPPGRG